MNGKNKKDKGTFVRLSQEEIDMLTVLKQKHFVNISRMFRESVKNLYDKLEKQK
jgi:hypothetical protein